MSDGDLRDKLTKAMRDGLPDYWWQPGEETIDALMPVVREALAQAWDEGHEAAETDLDECNQYVMTPFEWRPNPWRQEQP